MRPSFVRALADPSIRTVLIAGCGGGFDFVHGLALYPWLRRLGKRVVLGSYSFGDVEKLSGDAEVVFDEPPATVKRVSAATEHAPVYAPEVHVCSFLDAQHPASAPHSIYAYYARDFAVPILTRFYRQLIAEYGIDAVVLFDGGSDSLLRGDEHGLGDPIEDAVSVQTVAGLSEVPLRILISVGLGVDRHNGVSDFSALRAVAELSEGRGFLGAMALEREDPGFVFYRDLVRHIAERQSFRSIVASAVAATVEGRFGDDEVPAELRERLHPGSLFLWPLMGILWAFDVEAVAARSHLATWIRDAPTPTACYEAVRAGRKAMTRAALHEERLPEPRPWPLEDVFEAR